MWRDSLACTREDASKTIEAGGRVDGKRVLLTVQGRSLELGWSSSSVTDNLRLVPVVGLYDGKFKWTCWHDRGDGTKEREEERWSAVEFSV